jgi:hypothetical protein
MVENDSVDKKNVHIYPGLEAGYALSPKALLYGKVYSDYSQNLFYNQAKENPWVNNISQFSYLNTPLALALGLKGTTASFGFDVSAGLKQYKNYLAYAPTPAKDSAKLYAVNLRDTAVTLTYLTATATYKVSDKISVESGLLLQNVSSSFFAKIPNVPAFTWRLAPAFRFDKLTLVPSLIVKSSYYVWTTNLQTEESGAVYDLAAKVSYNMSHRLNLNLDAYNLANNKAYMYYGYRQRGLLVVLGGTFKF